jgi:hypothetical protein
MTTGDRDLDGAAHRMLPLNVGEIRFMVAAGSRASR